MAEKTLHDILDDLAPDAVRALAYAALNAWGQNRIEPVDLGDAHQGMLDALGANMPNQHDAFAHAESGEDELEMARRWRKLMGYVPIDENGNEIDAVETVQLPYGPVKVGVVHAGSINAHPFHTVHDPETGDTWGFAVPDLPSKDRHRYLAVLAIPDTVDPSDLDEDEATDLDHALNLVRQHPDADYYRGTYQEVLANIADEHDQRYITGRRKENDDA